MNTVKTEINSEHLELIKIFFKANDLPGVIVGTHYKSIGSLLAGMIEISYNDDDESPQISLLSLRNSGMINMLEDYLIKCGVSVKAINHPPPRYSATEEAFEEHKRKIGI